MRIRFLLAVGVAALILAAAGCSQISDIQKAIEEAGSEEAEITTNNESGADPTQGPPGDDGGDFDTQTASPSGGGGSDTGEDTGSSEDSEGVSLDQAVGDYYRAAGLEKWDYTYDHLDSRTQSMFSEEEWVSKNQWFWDRNPLIFHILSINLDNSSEESLAEVELRITGEDGYSWVRTTYFVFEDGEWKHRFSDEETGLFMPDAAFEEFVEAQGGTPSGDGEDSGESGVCAGVSGCEPVDSADVDGDGALDEVALVGEPEEYYATPRTRITVRVLLADGTTLTREVEIEGWPHDTVWHGATDFGQAPGEELVLGATFGAHTKWYQVLTYRDEELVQLPYPKSDPVRSDTFYAAMWPIDAALSAYVGVQCDTADSTVVLRSVTPPGTPSEDSTYEGEATSWVLDGDQWQMTDSRELEYPNGESAYEISGWQCGDLPQGYE